MRVHVQDDEDRAMRNAREFGWMQGEFTGMGKPWWVRPLATPVPSHGSQDCA